jgi:membrane protease subunit HflK
MATRTPPSLPFPENFPKGISVGGIMFAILVLIGIVGLFSSFYQVPANSLGVVQRFGAFHGITEPGLQFKLPFSIDTVSLVEVRRQHKLEFGFSTPGATNVFQAAYDRGEQEIERNMVTGDQNAAVVEWVVQYQISDPKSYLFNFREPEKTLRDLSEAVMREVVGDRTVDEVLTIGRQEMEVTALDRLKGLVSKLEMGIQIDQIQLRNVNPPTPVQASFDEVNRAQQEKEQMINQANGEYNKVVPRAKGEAEQKLSEAEGYATKRTNEAEGDAARFTAMLNEFQKAPEVTRKRIFLETLGEVLPNIPNKVILDHKAPQFLPMMPLRQNTPAGTTAPSGGR